MLTAPTFADRIQQQRDFFATGQTRSLDFRLEQLDKLKQAILDRKEEIVAAVRQDLGRPEYEGYFELAAIAEIATAQKNLKRWMKAKRVSVSFEQFPCGAWIQPEPLGVALIIGPWNYPFQLLISPLVGAIAAGNCAVLKPSEIAQNTARVVADLVNRVFPPEYVCALEGGVEVSQALLREKFDRIFFTGGTRIGRIVMEAAAKHLTPVTLELGGKSPCIVAKDAKLDVAAKRIAWGKFLNAGQTCIAPDYLLVDREVKAPLLDRLQACLREFYGDDPQASPDYARLVSDRHFDRLEPLLNDGQIVCGGRSDRGDRYIAPTILEAVNWDDAVMAEEIFGPILPVLTYDDLGAAIARINERPKPLALYVFSQSRAVQDRVLAATSSGGACINETVMHVGCTNLPFGGVGESGMGSYHGKASFDTFSHYKSVLKKGTWLDLQWRYAPYAGKLDFIKRAIGGI